MRDDTDLDGDFDGIDAQPLHERRYRVQAYRNEDGTHPAARRRARPEARRACSSRRTTGRSPSTTWWSTW